MLRQKIGWRSLQNKIEEQSRKYSIEHAIRDVKDQITVVDRKRLDLFDSDNEVKHYRANELSF